MAQDSSKPVYSYYPDDIHGISFHGYIGPHSGKVYVFVSDGNISDLIGRCEDSKVDIGQVIASWLESFNEAFDNARTIN